VHAQEPPRPEHRRGAQASGDARVREQAELASRLAWLNDEAPLSNGDAQPYGEIFVQAVDGKSEPIRLTHNKWEDSVPCWGAMPREPEAADGRRN
jgi:hypothetical protein